MWSEVWMDNLIKKKSLKKEYLIFFESSISFFESEDFSIDFRRQSDQSGFRLDARNF